MQTRAQKWSASAYGFVKQQAGTDTVGKYKTSCNKMPSQIHQSGLLQALVFQVARHKAGVLYVDQLAKTYFAALGATPPRPAGHQELIAEVQKADLHMYMAMTQDLSEIALWFRRFAQIELRDADEDEQ
jgi:CRISPR type III-B/RAMP module-associated protein Cmr5